MLFGLNHNAHAADKSGSNVSQAWLRYLEQKKQGKLTDLADYSYAGYQRGEKSIPSAKPTLNVIDFGALPDDMLDDRRGIQKAIDAAKKAGGGVVYLPAGRYLVNTDMNDRGTIKIETSNIVLKGAGSRADGTIIHQIHPFGGGNPHDFHRMHLGKNVLLIHSLQEEQRLSNKKTLCHVTADADRQTFSVTVDQTSNLKVGDAVYLYARNKAVIEEEIKPYAIEEAWTNTTQSKAYIVEIHVIKTIQGNRVIFDEPIRYNIKSAHNWELRERKPITNVGVEDISFMGNAYHSYKHHRSGMDDSGWAMIKIKGITNSYVQRVSFINCSQSLYVAQSSYVSMLNITVAGNTGHHGPRTVFFSYGVFGGLIDDLAGCSHGPSISGGAVGSVFWRWTGSDGSIDCHAGRPHTSLFDNVSVNRFSSSGGRRDYPQHLRQLMLWNLNMQANKPRHYDFWQPKKNNVFVDPMVVGLHGSRVTFNSKHLGYYESNGKAVIPESLYEAQITERLGKRPQWIDDIQQQQKQLATKPLPSCFSKDDATPSAYLYPETFNVNDMLTYLTSLSLQMYKTRLFTFTIKDPKATLKTDQTMLRHCLYMLMNAMYQQTQMDNQITAESMADGGTRFTITSGKIKRAMPDMTSDKFVGYAKTFASQIQGKLTIKQTDSQLEFVVDIPTLISH